MSRIMIALFLCIALSVATHAETITWDGSGNSDNSGNWSVAENWSPDKVPGEADTAVLPNVTAGTRTVTVDVPVTVDTLNVQQTRSAAQCNNISLGANLTIRQLILAGTENRSAMLLNGHVFTYQQTGNTLMWMTGGATDRIIKTGTTSLSVNYNGYQPFYGTWEIHNGIVRFGGYSRTPNTGRIKVVSNEDGSGTMDYDGHVDALWHANAYTLSGPGFNGVGAMRFRTNAVNPKPVTIDGDTSIGSESGVLGTLMGGLNGTGALTKVGLGTVAVGGSGNTWAGPTIVAAGTLRIAAPIASPVTVQAGATLEGPALFFPKDGEGNPLVTVEEGGQWIPGPFIWWGNGDPAAGGYWSEPTNWNHGAVPGVGDEVVIGSTDVARIITVDVPANLAKLRWEQTAAVNNTLDVLADVTCDAFEISGTASRLVMNVGEGCTFGYTGPFYYINYAGTGFIAKNGTETWSINYSYYPPFAGTWLVNNGIFQPSGYSRIQASGRITVNDGGTFDYQPNSDGPWHAKAYTLNGTGYTNQGALRFSSNSTVGKPVTLASDATVRVNMNITGTIGAPIDGPGGLRKVGPGTLVISGSPNSYEGETIVEEGTLKVLSPIDSPVTVMFGAVLEGSPMMFPKDAQDNPLVTVEEGGTWSRGANSWWGDGDPSADGNWSEPANWTWGELPNADEDCVIGSTSVVRTITVDKAAFANKLRWEQVGSTVNNNLVLDADLTVTTFEAAGRSDNVYNPDYLRMTINEGATFTFGGPWYYCYFAGTGTIVKNGPETWRINYGYALPFAGTFVVNNGIWAAHGWQRTHNAARMVVNDGATFQYEPNIDGPVYAKAFTLNGFGYDSLGALQFVSTSTNASPVTLASDTMINVNADVTGTLGGGVDGPGGLTKIGLGTLVISGSITYEGETFVQAGTLRVLSPITSAVIVGDGATLEGAPILFPTDAEGNRLVTVEPGGQWIYGPNSWWGDGDPTAGGNWSDPNNWTHGEAPADGSDVIIQSTAVERVITIDVPVSLNSLTWEQLTAGVKNTLDLQANLTVSTFDTAGGFADHVMDINEGTAFSVSGPFRHVWFTGTGTIVKNGTDTWYINYPDAVIPFAGTWVLNGGITQPANWSRINNSARIVVNSGATLDYHQPASGPVLANAFTLNGDGVPNPPLGGFGAMHVLFDADNSSAVTIESDASINVDAGATATFSGAIDGAGMLTKTGLGKLALSGTCTANVTVAAGTLAIENSTVMDDAATLRLTSGATVDLADGIDDTIGALYFDGMLQASGTWGRPGSGAANEDDTFFSGRLGILTVGSPAPTITQFAVADQSTGSSLFTNSADVDVTLAAEAVPGQTLAGLLVTETPDTPAIDDPNWASSITGYSITSPEGSITLYGWAKDDAGTVSRAATAVILFSTAVPAVSNIVVTDNGDDTATATWLTDIPAEGSLQYGTVSLTGATPNTVPENVTGTTHSVTFATAAGANYKIILVNNETASPAFYWPRRWPIEGDANMDCRVNILDLIFIRNKLNQDVGTGDNWKADVNEDTRINILDLIFVRNKLNTQCP